MKVRFHVLSYCFLYPNLIDLEFSDGNELIMV